MILCPTGQRSRSQGSRVCGRGFFQVPVYRCCFTMTEKTMDHVQSFAYARTSAAAAAAAVSGGDGEDIGLRLSSYVTRLRSRNH